MVIHIISDSGVSITGEEKSFLYNNCYTENNGQIYYNKPFRGYFLVKGADVNTFHPLNTIGDNGTMGKDKDRVYFKAEVVPGLNPAETGYLGNNFSKNSHTVFYGNIALKNADVLSFKHVSGYYAADKYHLYYKERIINNADPRTLHQVSYDTERDSESFEYLSDKNHVYYKGALIKDANPQRFTVLHVEDDVWGMRYAFDGKHYFYQEREILINKDPVKSDLRLLTLDRDFAWYGMFYQEKSIYCYDSENQKLVLLGTRDNAAPFTRIDRGLFTDGKHVYFIHNTSLWATRSRGLLGRSIGISVVEGANPANFKMIARFEGKGDPEGVIYQSGNKKYFHSTDSEGNRTAGLSLFTADGTIEDLPTDRSMSKYFKYKDAINQINFEFFIKIFKRDTDYNDN